MRTLNIVVGSLLALLPYCSSADDLLMEPHAMIYYQVPFGGGEQPSAASFGLRLDRAMVDRQEGIEYRQLLLRPALMDFQFTAHGMQQLSVAGTDYLKLYRIQRAAEEGAAQGGTAKPAQTPAKEKTTISKILEDASPGFIIGGGILVLLVSGVTR